MVGVSDALQVTDNRAESRFELWVDGLLAELPYRLNGKRLVLIHTEVPEELEGRGLGGALVTAAIDRAAREGLTVVPLCPFARGWLQRDEHGFLITGPDVLDGADEEYRWPLEREPYFLESSHPGVFFAGDVRHGSVKRIASAVGEGAMAVRFAHERLAGR